MTTLSARDVHFRYGTHDVLGGVDLSVGAGSCVAVVGRNGSGKSTLVRVCVGRERATSGRVTLDGRPVDDDDPWVRRRVAVLSGRPSHYPDLTVREHLELIALAHATPAPDAAVGDALDHLGLRDLADAFPQHLSSGQAQSLQLAALRVRPRDVVVLDEPEQHLDVTARAALGAWIADEAARGAAVLLVSHDPALVDACAGRVLTLTAGTLHGSTPVPDSGPHRAGRRDGPHGPGARPEGWTDAVS